MKILLIGSLGASYFAYQGWKRRPRKQISFIRKQFLVGNQSPYMNDLLLERKDVKKGLEKFFSMPPTNPLVIYGSAGTGVSWGVSQLLAKRKMTIMVNLRSNPVNSANELIYRIVSSCGYLMPSQDYFTRWIFKEKNPEKKPRIEKTEIDKSFQAIRQALEKEKSSGWKDGIPVLCVTNLGTPNSVFDLEDEDERPVLEKLFNFLMGLSNDKLIHIVFTCPYSFLQSVIDNLPGWQTRRLVFHLPEASPEEVRDYVNKYCERYWPDSEKLSSTDIDYMTKSLGGSLADIDHSLNMMRLLPINEVIHSIVGSSIEFIQCFLEDMLDKENGNKNYKQYLRFWKMMEVLASEKIIPRRQLINLLFVDHPKELDTYEKMGILSYVTSSSILTGLSHLECEKKAGEGDREGENEKEIECEDKKNTVEKTSDINRVVKKEMKVEDRETVKDKKVEEEELEEKEYLSEVADLEISNSVLEQERIWLKKQPVLVKASSTKMQYTFLVLTGDVHMKEQTRAIEEKLVKIKREKNFKTNQEQLQSFVDQKKLLLSELELHLKYPDSGLFRDTPESLTKQLQEVDTKLRQLQSE
eukprot:TRINITY_DN4465_c0_g1_i5.p1 TRINITY_DN4465_c0_g1~~TRINITY_DN4465_c0_g1_i5.p1  ORF type:complete len:609 (+),score=120.01 TRINITY_DN4465_c0_g1_i5:81-1829(+)